MVEQINRDGQCIGNYRLQRLLGQGGFAEVYLAEHIHLNTQAAVKLLNTHLADDGIENFRNEARMIASLVHPNIVRVLDFGVDNNVPYLVMDYAPNGTLRQRHQKGSRLPLQAVVSYVQQIAEALQYAHEQRLIHRDIKPENMLIGRRQEILLSDFGIALVAQSSQYQRTQNIAGTLAYMAPEQIQAHPRPASDQYSLGIVVYEWLGGQRPFQGTMTEVAIKHATATPPPLRHLAPDLPPAVEQVVLHALQKDPHDRFPTIQAFAESLQQASQPTHLFMGGISQAPTNNTPLNRSSTPFPGQAEFPAQNGVAQNSSNQFAQPVLPTGNQLPLTTPYPYNQPPSMGNPAWQQPAYQANSTNQISSTPQIGQQVADPGGQRISRRTVIASIAGSAALIAVAGGLAYYYSSELNKTSAGSKNPSNQHEAHSSDTGASTTTPTSTTTTTSTTPLMAFNDHTKTIWAAAWSPNGNYIASASSDGTSHVWSVTTKQRLLSYRSQIQPAQSDDWAYSVCWSPDSTKIVIGFSDGTAQLVDVTTYQEKGSYDSTAGGDLAGSLYGVAISPDGNSVAIAGFFSNDIQIFNVKTQQKTLTLSGHSDTVWGLSWSHNGKYIASCSSDATARVWDGITGKQLLIYDKHGDDVRAVSWSPDDTRIVSCSTTGPVYVWASDSGQTLLTYGSQDDFEILGAAWSHNGKYIASAGGSDTYTHIWNAQNGQTLHEFPSGSINSVCWSPDDTRIVTANNDTVQVWQL